MKCTIKGVGITAPGLRDWHQAQQIFCGKEQWSHTAIDKLSPNLLPPNERRRTTQLIKLALQAAEEAQRHSGIPAEALASVFASSDGDTDIVNSLCQALTLPERAISPTQFHNSVHNAAAGYWTIAGKARRHSTSISTGAASFASGILEAMSRVVITEEPVLLVAYDIALPGNLDRFGINHEHFAVALVLTTVDKAGIATLSLAESAQESDLAVLAELAPLYQANPAAESLPLLHALATKRSAIVAPAYFDNSALPLMVSPC